MLGSNVSAPLADPADQVYYRPQRQFRLRGLLFNNPFVESIRERAISDEEKWREWMDRFADDSTKLGDQDMGYLRGVFSSFDDFAKAIELLRSSAFEARSNKRWSSKFVFPFGPDALYEDLRIDAKGGASNDRRFFARTGELLYLMLSRAARGPELGAKLVDRLFDPSKTMNRLVKAMQGDAQLVEKRRGVGPLPYDRHPRFDRMCEDWLAILSRDMPVYDALEHLIVNTGLNLLLYFLECAKTVFCAMVSEGSTIQGLAIRDALGWALPWVGLPRDTSFFSNAKTFGQAFGPWKKAFEKLFVNRAPLLARMRANGQPLDPEEMHLRLAENASVIDDSVRVALEAFIAAPFGADERTSGAVALLEWERDGVHFIFEKPRVQQRGLADATLHFFDNQCADDDVLDQRWRKHLDELRARERRPDVSCKVVAFSFANCALAMHPMNRSQIAEGAQGRVQMERQQVRVPFGEAAHRWSAAN